MAAPLATARSLRRRVVARCRVVPVVPVLPVVPVVTVIKLAPPLAAPLPMSLLLLLMLAISPYARHVVCGRFRE